MEKIAVFTNNTEGGIIQFAMELLRDLNELGYSTLCYLPDNAKYSLREELKKWLRPYKNVEKGLKGKLKELTPGSTYINNLTKGVLQEKPDLIWIVDDLPVSCQIGLKLRRKTKVWMTIHDPVFHPSDKASIKKKIYSKIWWEYRLRLSKRSDSIIMLSNESIRRFSDSNIGLTGKIKHLELGAHIPEVKPICPHEYKYQDDPFLLFFGRLEKYKGLDMLVKTFSNMNAGRLIIAGKGSIQKELVYEINSSEKIVFINRFIKDEEMLWLFQNTKGIVLPYTEASQSGIIPIAYYYGKPVVVSEIQGLTQYVKDKSTGYICITVDQYMNAYNEILSGEHEERYISECKAYYKSRFEWKNNLKDILNSID